MQKSTTKIKDIACKAKLFPPYLRQAAKTYVATSHSVVRQETIEYPSKELLLYDFLHKRSTWCLKDCDKQRWQTTVSINLSKSFAGQTGDWFDVKTASICTTELWDALKNFILTSLKIKVAPYPIIVSLDTLKHKAWHWFVIWLRWTMHVTRFHSPHRLQSFLQSDSSFFFQSFWNHDGKGIPTRR